MAIITNNYVAVIFDKYVPVISDKYVPVISVKYVLVISNKYVPVISDNYMAVISYKYFALISDRSFFVCIIDFVSYFIRFKLSFDIINGIFNPHNQSFLPQNQKTTKFRREKSLNQVS